jgi:hypothetical protein
MDKRSPIYILFASVAFICALVSGASEYVQCEDRFPDEMLDMAVMTDEVPGDVLHFMFRIVSFSPLLPTTHLPYQMFSSFSSSDPCIHSEAILSTVLRI